MNDQSLNLLFVSEVEKHEVLYNYTLPGYSRKDITEKAWQEVAANVNISVAECREKWRNLRTVFIRKMKPTPCGFGAKKKAYYLAEAMQFCLPYIKALALPSTGHFPQIPQYESTEEVLGNEGICNLDSLEIVQSPPTPPSYNPPATSEQTILPQDNTAVRRQHNTRPLSQSSRVKRSLTKRNKSASDADRCVAEYFKAKKARLELHEATTSSQNIDRKEALKMFLLSLIPELEELNDSQIKLFKRRIFCILDEISNQPQPQCSSFVTLLSPNSGYSPTSDHSNNSGN